MTPQAYPQKHFLYYIFTVDKEENPMPPTSKQHLLCWLRQHLGHGRGEGDRPP